MYTQCPYCQTVFKLRAHDLSAARGMVRCGACQQAYDASQHLLDDLPLIPGEPLASPDISSHSSIGQQPHAVEAEPEPEPERGHQPAPEPEPTHWSEAQPEPTAEPDLPEPEPEEEEEPASEPASLIDLGSDDPGPDEPFDPEPALTAEEAAWLAGESDIDPLADLAHDEVDLEDEIEPVDLAQVMAGDDDQPAAESDASFDPSLDLGGLMDTQEFDHRNNPHAKSAASGESAGARLTSALSGITSALDGVPTPAWLAGSLLLLLSLPLQLIHQHPTWLVDHYPLSRPLTEALCGVTGCQLPIEQDLLAIALTDRQVRTHPDHPQALLIEGEITNRAPFDQPYPVMEVILSNQAGKPVAMRRFQPIEYLTDPNQASTIFRSRYKTTIQLQVLDPGDQAVSFAFDFI